MTAAQGFCSATSRNRSTQWNGALGRHVVELDVLRSVHDRDRGRNPLGEVHERRVFELDDVERVEGDGERHAVSRVKGNERSVGKRSVDEEQGQQEGGVGYLAESERLPIGQRPRLRQVVGRNDRHFNAELGQRARKLHDPDLAPRRSRQHRKRRYDGEANGSIHARGSLSLMRF